jgi:hypothetical protein
MHAFACIRGVESNQTKKGVALLTSYYCFALLSTLCLDLSLTSCCGYRDYLCGSEARPRWYYTHADTQVGPFAFDGHTTAQLEAQYLLWLQNELLHTAVALGKKQQQAIHQSLAHDETHTSQRPSNLRAVFAFRAVVDASGKHVLFVRQNKSLLCLLVVLTMASRTLS